MSSKPKDPDICGKDDFEDLIYRGDLRGIDAILLGDLLDNECAFNKRLNLFKERVLSLLCLVVDGNLDLNIAAGALCSVQRRISPKSPHDLPNEQVMLYVGPRSSGDPLLVASVVTDFLWILEQKLGAQSAQTLQNPKRERLIEISKKLIEDFIPSTLIRERMELDFQYELGIILDVKNAYRREVRTRTSLLYVQKKYNLFREESEGYSKLVVEISLCLERLKEMSSPDKTPMKEEIQEAAQKLLCNILSISGHFSMDPNRIIDVILDMFASNIASHWEFFLHFLSVSPWKNNTNPSTDAGSRCTILSEVLGTKFTGHDPKSHPQNVPRCIYVMAALLIKHKLTDVDYIYSRLSPPDSEFESIAAKYYDNIKGKESVSGRFQSQHISGQLGDLGVLSTAVTSACQSSTSSNVTDPVKISGISCCLNQKASLVKASLEIGDIKTAFSIMGRVFQISEIYSDIPELICRLLYCIIDPHDPNPVTPSKQPPLNIDPANIVKTISVKKAFISSRIARSCKISTPHYEYFYNLWNADLPIITDSLRFVTQCRVYLSNVGVNLHRDPAVLAKIIRIGAKHVSESRKRLNNSTSSSSQQSHLSKEDKFFSVNHKQVLNSWLNLVSYSILPAMSRADPNPANSYGLWQIIREYPAKTRYALYGEWKYRIYDEFPEVRLARTSCSKDCRYIMIRLSKDIIKQSGRQIAKIVHSNPLISFTYIIRQIKSYDNMIPHIIDATRYLTDLEFDIFAYCITEALATETSSRCEGNDITIAPWLKYLASFTGRLYRKHSIDLYGLLMYIMSQLLKSNVYELIVLQELVGCMSGIKPIDEITSSQLDSLSGGDTLRREVFFYENSKAIKKSSSRLSKALIDSGLSSKFAIILAQLRQRFTSHDPGDEYEKDQKTVIWLSDFCGKVFTQYLDFMSTDLSPPSYESAFQSFEVLTEEYSLDPEYAFAIARPILSHPLQLLTPDGTINDGENRQKCIKAIINMLPQTVWEGISPDFYFEFWRLSSKDFSCPTSLYNSEIKAQQKIKKNIESDIAAGTGNASKFNKKIEKINSLIKSLEAEKTAQENYNKNVIEHIKKESKSWFSKSVGHNETINAMIQYCLYPRCTFSPGDAVYTAKFILLMHSLGVPNIATISLYDKLLNGDIFHAMIFSASEDEAKSYGVFLTHTFDTLSSWRKFPELFEREAIGVDLPGFLKKWPLKSDQNNQVNFSTAEYILHNEFRQAMRKWHLKMFRAIIYCLRSGDYVRIRNSFLVLDKLIDHFPITKEMGKHLEHCVMEIEKNEVREDLKQLARSYYSKMQIKKHIWVNTSDFCPSATHKQGVNDQCNPPQKSSTQPLTSSSSTKSVQNNSQDTQTSNVEQPLISTNLPPQHSSEINKSLLISPQHSVVDNDLSSNPNYLDRFGQNTRPNDKKSSPTYTSASRERWAEQCKEEGTMPRKPIAPLAADYTTDTERDLMSSRQPISSNLSRLKHSHKLASEVRGKDTSELQATRVKPGLELGELEKKQEHPKSVEVTGKDHRSNSRLSVGENFERQPHTFSRHEMNSDQGDKDVYTARPGNSDYYQKRSNSDEKLGLIRSNNSNRPSVQNPRPGLSLQNAVGQSIPNTALRVQELPAIDIMPRHQSRGMGLFIMRPHSVWPRTEDSNPQRLYHGKPLKITRTVNGNGQLPPPGIFSSQRTKDHPDIPPSLKKCQDEPLLDELSSKEYKSHERDKKKPRSIDRSKYSRKRKERDSDQFNGSQEKRIGDKKITKRYSKAYTSNDFEEDTKSASVGRKDSKLRDKDLNNHVQSGNVSNVTSQEGLHRGPDLGHQVTRGSFQHQDF